MYRFEVSLVSHGKNLSLFQFMSNQIIKKHDNGSYNIHTIKCNKFKNIQIEVVFRNNINLNNNISQLIRGLGEDLGDTSWMEETTKEE